jgi:hypothetical protein
MNEILEHRRDKNRDSANDVLNNDEVMTFLKIKSCNDNLKGLFENYVGVAMKSTLDYIVPLMKVSTFKDFLIHEQHEQPIVIEKWLEFLPE